MPPHIVAEVTELAPHHRPDLRPRADGPTHEAPDSRNRSDPTKEGEMTTTEPLKAVRRNSIEGLCERLGVPRRDWHFFRRWAGESLNSKALDELHAYVDVMIGDRCRAPGTDVLSELIETGIDGEELTDDELRAIVATLVTRAD
jgi:cytochrome P450